MRGRQQCIPFRLAPRPIRRRRRDTERDPLANGIECYIGLEHLDPKSLKIRRTLAKYQLHHEQELFEKAYDYIAEYD